ncbi:MAG: hypothetical protein RL682_1375 [Pseudomonadota bacterium]
MLFKGSKPLRRGADFAHHALIEAGDSHRTQQLQWLTWRRWLDTHGHAKLEPKRWLYFNYAHQILQAALVTCRVSSDQSQLDFLVSVNKSFFKPAMNSAGVR